MITDLAKVSNDKAIAQILNRMGYRTGQGKSWRAHRVAGLRNYHHIPPFRKTDDWLTLEQTANELGVSNTVVKRFIREKTLPAKQVIPCAPWVIERKDLNLPEIQRQVAAIKKGRKLPRTDPDQRELLTL